jgi:hypothetical protein
LPDEEIVKGGLYAHNYLRADEILRDSPRMRFRLAKLFEEGASHQNNAAVNFGEFVERELGIPVLQRGPMKRYFPYVNVTKEAEIVDLLHMITLLFRHFENQRRNARVLEDLLSSIQRIFDETNVGYQLDEKGGVHPKFDEEFERVRLSTIRHIGAPEFEAVRLFGEATEQAMLANPLNGKAAIRSTFDAVENLYKQMFSKTPQLNKANIRINLKQLIEKLYDGDANKNARRSSLKQVEALIDWVDGAHEYRHAPGTPEPSLPPEGLAILCVSQGFAYVRWLAELKTSIPTP